ncbi:MAG TPA: COX15/CtaA family protein [Rudaea sp.]|nr:COX15/CtaA family protein [Rudaea sp.]
MRGIAPSLRSVRRLAWIAAALALLVIVFGAFVRLSNAGLSCPDWPTCYGKLTWPTQPHDVASANAAFPDRPVETDKAWREQVHRMLVGGLSLVTFALAGLAFVRRRELGRLALVPLFAALFIVFQAALGMWTVTLKLLPLVVASHLVGGLTMLALLAGTALALSLAPVGNVENAALRRASAFGIALLAVQIALGGWTSANYAALACGTDFPTCLGQWHPPTDFGNAFVLWRGIGVDYEGGVLDAPARTAIQLAHRLGALVVFIYGIALAAFAMRRRETRMFGAAMAVLLLAQVALGIGNVVLGLPLAVATAHNGVAALLLCALLALWVRLRRAAPDRDGARTLL